MFAMKDLISKQNVAIGIVIFAIDQHKLFDKITKETLETIIKTLYYGVALAYIPRAICPKQTQVNKNTLSEYTITKSMKSVDGMVVGVAYIPVYNPFTKTVDKTEMDVEHSKDNDFGDIFIYKTYEGDKVEYAFVEGDNKNSDMINIIDFVTSMSEYERNVIHLMDKVVTCVDHLFYPVFFMYFGASIFVLKSITK